MNKTIVCKDESCDHNDAGVGCILEEIHIDGETVAGMCQSYELKPFGGETHYHVQDSHPQGVG